MREWMTGLDPAADRVLAAVSRERRDKLEQPPTPRQVAMVLHALADYTALQQALRYTAGQDRPHDFAQSVGRWLHDLADAVEEADRRGVPRCQR